MTDLFDAASESSERVLIIEADGGSRGNPGPAAYGALVKDKATGELLAEDAGYVGKETNNVAEYRGLISGLEMSKKIDPYAAVEAYLDSKLVVEQMSGNWKIKKDSLRALAQEAQQVALGRKVSYQWIPREKNAHADRLANEAMDAHAVGREWTSATPVDSAESAAQAADKAVEKSDSAGRTKWEPANATEFNNEKPWSMRAPFSGEEPATTLILVRHGRTEHTHEKRMSGADGSDPHLSEQGKDDAERVANEVAKIGVSGPWAHLQKPTHVVSSPMNRANETAEAIAEKLNFEVEIDQTWIEASFGEWENKTAAEIEEETPGALEEWKGSMSVAPPAGESLEAFVERSRQARKDLVKRYAGQTIVSVSHATPVRVTVLDALGAKDEALWRLLVSPASISIVRFWGEEASDTVTINQCNHLS